MHVETFRWTSFTDDAPPALRLRNQAQLVLAFGESSQLSEPRTFHALRRCYPDARVLSCSTAGVIEGGSVVDDVVVTTAIHFASTRVEAAQIVLGEQESSLAAGVRLGAELPRDELVHVLVFTDGLVVNGTELVRGLATSLPPTVTITGGMAGDGSRFQRTVVALDGPGRERALVAVGLYGQKLQVGFGSLGGWDPFGPERRVTRSDGNVLYELDGRSALALYKEYLGEFAVELPASGLRFPISLRTDDGRDGLTRTILAVDEESQSLTFAGDIPLGAHVRLMKANFDRLVDGAQSAAKLTQVGHGDAPPQLALLISCVGRRIVLGQRVDEELEAVREVLGESTELCGLYSYGELCPAFPGARCDLHNQTMTITTLSER